MYHPYPSVNCKFRSLLRLGIGIFFTIISCSFASSQSLSFLTYSLDEGLPQSQVWASISDTQGYLWFGTQGGGLARYDGQRFKIYTAQQGLATDYINSILAVPHDQRIWVGTSRGLSYLQTTKEVIHTVKGGKKRINSLAFSDQHLLVGTEAGLLVYNSAKDSLEEVAGGRAQLLDNREIFCLERIGKELLIGTDRGLYRRDENGRFFIVDHLPRQPIYAIESSQDGNSCWVAVYLDGIIQLGLPGLQPLDTIADLQARQALDLLADPDGSLWIGDRDWGLGHYKNGRIVANYGEAEGLPHNHVRQLVFDREGELWVATSGGGAARVLPLSFRHYSRRDGLAGERVYAVHRTTADELLISVSNQGIQRQDSMGNFRSLPVGEAGLSGQNFWLNFNVAKIKSISSDPAGRIYAGTEGQGLYIIDTTDIKQITRREGLPSDWIQEVITHPNGSIYLATYSDGLARLNWTTDSTYQISRIDRRRGVKDLRIGNIEFDPAGNLWASSKRGHVYRFQNDRVIADYNSEHGLPNADLRSLAFDNYGRLWVAARGKGLYWAKLSDEELFFLPYAENDKLASTNIYLLQATEEGLWVGSETGVELLAFAATGGVPGPRRFYGRAEGFLGVETCHNAVTSPDKNGKIWFGTMNGLMLYQPGLNVRRVPPPKLHLTDITLFYRSLEETAYAQYRSRNGVLPGLEFRHQDNNLSFAFTAVDLTYPDRVRYRFRLNTADTVAWSPPNRTSEVSFAGLQAGEYTFEVQATNDGKNWSDTQTVSFLIAMPFWQTNWFFWLAGLSLLLLLSVFAWLLVRRVKRKEAIVRKQLETENQLLQLEQKALQLQMNPHFIFNALTSIRGLVGTENEEKAKSEINNFAALMRGVLNNSRKNSISLAEEIKVLDQYLRVEQFCQAVSFDYSIEVDEKIDPEEIEIPPMLLQPFVENAVVHGIANLGHPGEIKINFKLEKELLHVSIQDNGIGREAAKNLRQTKKPGHQSVALAVTRQRLDALSGKADYRPLIIQDRRSAAGEIIGTEVLVYLPVEVW